MIEVSVEAEVDLDDRAISNTLSEPPRHIAKVEQTFFILKACEFAVNAVKSLPGAAGLAAPDLVEQGPRMLDQWQIRRDHIGRQWLVVIGVVAPHQTEWQAPADEPLPVAIAGLFLILRDGIHHSFVRAASTLKSGEGSGEFQLIQHGQVGNAVPVGFSGQQVRSRKCLYRFADKVMDPAGVFALAEQMHEPAGVLATGLTQDRLNRLIDQAGRFDLFDQPPSRRESQLKSVARRQLGKQGVQRADLHPMQLSRQLLKQLETLVPSDLRVTNELLKPREFLRVGDRGRETDEDTIENFSRSFASERRCQNSFRASGSQQC